MKKLSVVLVSILLVVSVSSLVFSDVVSNTYQKSFSITTSENAISTSSLTSKYQVIGWNDLGMHCISPSFKEMAILPPFNNLFVQVIQKGDPPQLATTGITVEYYIKNNTVVSGKTDFWQYVQQLFGVVLPEGVGLTGNGLSGVMQLVGDHFEATGIPILPFKDSMVWNPYQTAVVTVKDGSGAVVASTKVVIPVSDELNCAKCHGAQNTEVNILTLHDTQSGTALMSQRPVLCASCHSSNALGTAGTGPEIPF
jgi:cytochrome c553